MRTAGGMGVTMGQHDAATARERALIEVGQCVVCVHGRKLTSAKGSDFYRCERAKQDERLRTYPPLPVRSCFAFEARDDPRSDD